MNTNPLAKRILCYGDSITRWRVPSLKKRFWVHERWTGVLQDALWSSFEVIEEWLRGRTTNLYDKDVKGKNWLEYFLPCVYSHLPLDFVIIFLWTNNLQKQFQENMESIASSFDFYIKVIQDASWDYELPVPKVILVSPPYIDWWYLKNDTIFTESSEQESYTFADAYKQKADALGLYYFDAAKIVWSGRGDGGDGVHLDQEQNRLLWISLASYIQTL